MPAVKAADVALTLVKLAQLAADVPEVRELDINPLLADQNGVLALDARIAVAPLEPEPKFKGAGLHPISRCGPIRRNGSSGCELGDGTTCSFGRCGPKTRSLLQAFLERITAEDLRLRFFAPVKYFSHAFLARLTQLDYARAMAFVALDEASGELLGVVRLHADANYENAEYAVLVRSDLKGHGIGWKLMELMIRYARSENLKCIEGQVLQENTTMLDMCRQLGFQIADDPNDKTMKVVRLELR